MSDGVQMNVHQAEVDRLFKRASAAFSEDRIRLWVGTSLYASMRSHVETAFNDGAWAAHTDTTNKIREWREQPLGTPNVESGQMQREVLKSFSITSVAEGLEFRMPDKGQLDQIPSTSRQGGVRGVNKARGGSVGLKWAMAQHGSENTSVFGRTPSSVPPRTVKVNGGAAKTVALAELGRYVKRNLK